VDDVQLTDRPVPERVQSYSRLRFAGYALLFAGVGVGFWLLVLLLRGHSGAGTRDVAMLVLGACAAAVVAGVALGLAATRRFNALHEEAAPRGRKTDSLEWTNPRVVAEKGRVAVRVSGNCVLCDAPRAVDRGLITQMHAGTGGFGLTGYAASSVRYAREKKRFGWPEGAKALVVNVPLCEDCRVRFPRWALAALALGVLGSVAVALLGHPAGAAARSLHFAMVFTPGTVGAAIALAGVMAREVPVPVRTKRWRERIEVEIPVGRALWVDNRIVD